MAPLKLYYYPPCPPYRAVQFAIEYLKIDVEKIIVDLSKEEQLKPEFLKINPQHCLPTIDDDGYIMWESRAILAYLVNFRAPGSSLYPLDPKKRGLIDSRLSLDSSIMHALGNVIGLIYSGETTIPQEKKDKVYTLLGHLNNFIEGKNYIAGDELTIADFSFLSTFATLKVVGANVAKFPNLMDWYKRCESVPGFQVNEDGAKALIDYIASRTLFKGESWDE
ncbi:glutathione S-transferase 1-like [Lutzomyia longipalpis]|uniref:glutathione transferase n=2 Tax=Lutzomyia longipalpis TaxID=7200 RepID=A0A3F2ZDK5_LUTLO|nr:glutathione S-transferase 1-like [Lutzomyia longipalpis]